MNNIRHTMTNMTIMKFLKLYRRNTCLWNPNLLNYKNRKCINLAWEDIRQNIGVECTVTELKKKKESLMSAYRSYKARIKRSEKSGGEIYKPTWFAFSYMDSFLGDVYKCNASTSNIEDLTAEQDDENLSIGEDPLLTVNDEAPSYKKKVEETTHHYNKSKVSHKPKSSKITHGTKFSQAKKQMDDAFKLIRTTIQHQDLDNECSIFGVLVAKKLMKLSEHRRDVMMVKINQLFVDENNESRHLSDQVNSASSTTVVMKTSSSPEYENATGWASSSSMDEDEGFLNKVKVEVDQ